MCGIAGILEFDGRAPSPGTLETMADRLQHRGPDDRGICIDGPCGLVHTRLAILDPDKGRQPLCDQEKKIWITYNGEIYNSPSLRKYLQKKGYIFRTTTDTEVIVNLYHYGPTNFVEKLEGIFAFAIWDSRNRKITIARDYIGVKPLYIYEGSEGIVFGSEIKALLVDPRVPCEVDPFGLNEILAFQNTYPRRTCFKDIRLIEGGEIFVIGANRSRRSRRFWIFSTHPVDKRLSFEKGAERLLDLCRKTISDQLLSDVPVACYLSGGMDTGAITALAGQTIPELMTFSGGFLLNGVPEDLRGYDERQAAEMMSRHFNTRHYFREIGPIDLMDSFGSIAWHLEEPRGSTCYAPWIMAKEVGTRVKVVLSGHGGDELFAGYHGRYQLAQTYTHNWENSWFNVLNYVVPNSTAADWLHPDYVGRDLLEWPRQVFEEFAAASRGMSPQARAQHHDLFVYMQGLLMIEDKLSMAHSLESRVPFLDRRLFEFAWTIPDSWKLNQKQGKVILRNALRNIIPDSILEREKMGFGPPEEHYYRSKLASLFDMLLLDGSLSSRKIFRPEVIKGIVKRQRQGENLSGIMWTLASIELWHRTFFDRESALRHNPLQDLLIEPVEIISKQENPVSSTQKPTESLKQLVDRNQACCRQWISKGSGGLSRLWTLVKQALKFTAFAIFFRNWWERISGQCVLKLRAMLERYLRNIPKSEPKKRIRVFHGLYPTVQAMILSNGLKTLGAESRYETIADNFRYPDPDEYHTGVLHPDIGYEHVEFIEETLLAHVPIFFNDYSLNRLTELMQRRWEKFDVFHFGWFLSLLPDNLDVEFIRRSGRLVYFHYRGCFILSLKLKDQLATTEMDIASACAYCKSMGWRDQYFSRFYRGINQANRIFVSTPNLCHCSENFEYMPLILDPDMEKLSIKRERKKTSEILTIVHAVGDPGHFAVKGSDHIMKAVEAIQKEGLNVRFQLIENMTRQQATKIMREGDILVEQLNLGAYGNVALEAMAHGLPVISSLHSSVAHLVPGCPILNADTSNVVDRLRELVTNPELRREVGRRSYDFVRKFHSSKVVTSHLLNIYKADFGLIPSKRTNTMARKHPAYE